MTSVPIDLSKKSSIDLSLGDAVLGFEAAYDYGNKKAKAHMHKYDNDGSRTADIAEGFCPHLSRILDAPINKDNICVTTGTSAGFSLILDELKNKIDRFNEMTGQQLKPVIIMPVPTYGLFKTAAMAKGFTIYGPPRNAQNRWRIDPRELEDIINAINNTGEHIVMGYFDSNPNNPCSTIRTSMETQELAKAFANTQGWYRNNIDAFKERGRSYPPELKEELQKAIESFPSGVTIIDDIVYSGTEYNRKAPLSSFLSCPETAKHTCVIAGGSKIGLANKRGGIIIANEKNTAAYRSLLKRFQYFPDESATHAMTYVFSDDAPFRQTREQHLEKLAKAHQFSGKLMKAMISGIDQVHASAEEKEHMTDLIMKVRHVNKASAEHILSNGLKKHNVRVLTDPEAGFFHLIEFPDMKGRFTRHPTSNSIFQISSQNDLQQACYREKLLLCSGHYCGVPEDQLVFRISFASIPEEIIEAVGRLENIVKDCKKTQAEANQLPLFNQQALS